jgi:hypothetical protein
MGGSVPPINLFRSLEKAARSAGAAESSKGTYCLPPTNSRFTVTERWPALQSLPSATRYTTCDRPYGRVIGQSLSRT